jgi:hypothetical protein
MNGQVALKWRDESNKTLTFFSELCKRIRSAHDISRKFSTAHQALGWDRSSSYLMSSTGAPDLFSIALTALELCSLSCKYCTIARVFKFHCIVCTAFGSHPLIFWQCPPMPGVLARVSLMKRSRKLRRSMLMNLPPFFMKAITRE